MTLARCLGIWYLTAVNGGRHWDWLQDNRRFILLGYDVLVWFGSIAVFTVLRYMDFAQGFPQRAMVFVTGVAVILQISIGAALGLYRDRYRIGSKDEAIVVVITAILVSALVQLVTLTAPGTRIIALSVPLGAGAMAAMAMVGGRAVWRMMHESAARPAAAEPVLVFGAGNAGSQLVTQMLNDPSSPYLPV